MDARKDMEARRIPYVSPLLVCLAVAVFLSGAATEWLQFDRSAISNGQFWRLLTCHWTHYSLDHLFWDGMVLLVLGACCECGGRTRFLVCVVGSACLISLAVWLCLPELEFYRGLSGIDSALFVLLAVDILREKVREKRWRWVGAGACLFVLFLAKLGFEIVTGTTVFVDSAAAGMAPVPLSHFVGMLTGMAGLMEDFN